MTTSKDKLVKAYVEFDLPYVLFLEDSLDDLELREWARAYLSNEEILPDARYAPKTDRKNWQILGSRLPVNIPEKDLAEAYEINLADIVVKMVSLRRVNTNRQIFIVGEAPGDRHGRTSFSSIRIIIDINDKNIKLDLIDIAIRAINHFVDHYRTITKRYYLQPVTKNEIQEFKITYFYDDGTSKESIRGVSSGPMHMFGGAISVDDDKNLRSAIKLIGPPNIFNILDLNIKNYFELEQYRLVVIESAVAYEAWMYDYLKKRYKRKGINKNNIDDKFYDFDKKGNKHYKSITNISKTLVLDATGFEFEKTNEYKDWENDVRDIRNKIVHGEKFDVTKNEADKAFSTVLKCTKLLDKI